MNGILKGGRKKKRKIERKEGKKERRKEGKRKEGRKEKKKKGIYTINIETETPDPLTFKIERKKEYVKTSKTANLKM
jgi:hypothetical protein